jgi:hypothetical protein
MKGREMRVSTSCRIGLAVAMTALAVLVPTATAGNSQPLRPGTSDFAAAQEAATTAQPTPPGERNTTLRGHGDFQSAPYHSRSATATKDHASVTNTLGGNEHPARSQPYTSAGARSRAGEGTGGALSTPTSQSQSSQPTTAVPNPPLSGNGFSWGDAAVGAAATTGLLLVLFGVSLLISRRRAVLSH